MVVMQSAARRTVAAIVEGAEPTAWFSSMSGPASSSVGKVPSVGWGLSVDRVLSVGVVASVVGSGMVGQFSGIANPHD